MSLDEKKRMLTITIRKLEDTLVQMRYINYDGFKSREERDCEMDKAQNHLHLAHSTLVLLIEEELSLRQEAS